MAIRSTVFPLDFRHEIKALALGSGRAMSGLHEINLQAFPEPVLGRFIKWIPFKDAWGIWRQSEDRRQAAMILSDPLSGIEGLILALEQPEELRIIQRTIDDMHVRLESAIDVLTDFPPEAFSGSIAACQDLRATLHLISAGISGQDEILGPRALLHICAAACLRTPAQGGLYEEAALTIAAAVAGPLVPEEDLGKAIRALQEEAKHRTIGNRPLAQMHLDMAHILSQPAWYDRPVPSLGVAPVGAEMHLDSYLEYKKLRTEHIAKNGKSDAAKGPEGLGEDIEERLCA